MDIFEGFQYYVVYFFNILSAIFFVPIFFVHILQKKIQEISELLLGLEQGTFTAAQLLQYFPNLISALSGSPASSIPSVVNTGHGVKPKITRPQSASLPGVIIYIVFYGTLRWVVRYFEDGGVVL